MKVDELSNSVTLDIFLVLRWFDPRYSMPNLWSRLHPSIASFDIAQAKDNYNPFNGLQAQFWLPDTLFPEMTESSVSNYYIKVYPNGEFRWMRHLSITTIQSTFEYQHYPKDKQTIALSMFSFTLSTSQMQLVGFENVPFGKYTSQPTLIFSNNPANGDIEFNLNPCWSYLSSNVTFTETTMSPYNTLRSTITVYITVQRKSKGIVFRLLVPIFLLLLIGISQFWAGIQLNPTLSVMLIYCYMLSRWSWN